MAETAKLAHHLWWSAVSHWSESGFFPSSKLQPVRFLLAAGVHVLAQLGAGRLVPGDDAPPFRCRLVRADPQVLRAFGLPGVSVDGGLLRSRWLARSKDLRLGEDGSSPGSRPGSKMATVHLAGLLLRRSSLFRRLVASRVAAPPLVL